MLQADQHAADIETIHALQKGDSSALAALYDRYHAILFGLILRILHSQAEAEDVLQDVFLQVWQRAASFDAERGKPVTWLITLARSRAIDRLRALKSRGRTVLKSARDENEEVSDAVSDAILSEKRRSVRSAMEMLTPEQQKTLDLAYFEGLTQSEIAERTGDPLGTIKTRMRSGVAKLKELMSAAGVNK